jgi:protein-S-isoprenylcysteine O-methyltransferase Ste14
MTSARLFLAVFLFGSLSFRLARLTVAIHKAKSHGTGRRAARPIFWIMTISYLIYLAFCGREGFQRAGAFCWPVSALGLLFYAGALALRERAMRDLGRFFSPDIEIRKAHQVVREGLYRYMRHPLLVCMAGEILGLGLIFNAYASLLFVGLGFYLPLIVVRKTLEERALIEALGEAYRAYQREVGAFWPRLGTVLRPKRGPSHV